MKKMETKPETKEETYHHSEKCANCGAVNRMEIPKGKTIRDFIQHHPCYRCGCSLGQILRDIIKW